jgi:hypothetical protein
MDSLTLKYFYSKDRVDSDFICWRRGLLASFIPYLCTFFDINFYFPNQYCETRLFVSGTVLTTDNVILRFLDGSLVLNTVHSTQSTIYTFTLYL